MSKQNNQDLFAINLEQTKRIFEMEKQLGFWKDKVCKLSAFNFLF